MKSTITLFLLSLTLVLWNFTPAYAGSSFENLSKSTSFITIKNAEALNKIVEQLIEARKASQKALSKEEIERIREQAKEVLAHQIEKEVDAGAAVFTGSQVIE